MLHAATYLTTLRKVEAYSTFPVTRKAIFRRRTYCKERGLHVQLVCNLDSNAVTLQSCRKNWAWAACGVTASLVSTNLTSVLKLSGFNRKITALIHKY